VIAVQSVVQVVLLFTEVLYREVLVEWPGNREAVAKPQVRSGAGS
jgi:hypothetical protein